jgi:hypothetical protein
MFPSLTYPAMEARRFDRYPDARRRRTKEIRVHEQLRRTRRRTMSHRPHSTLAAGY